MNQFILNIMKVYCISSVIYILYSLYLRYTKAENIEDILKDNEELLNKYKKIKKNRIMVFIIGIVIGLVFLIINEPSISSSIQQIANSTKSIVNDVSDISVI
jgi:hypothetical protein